MARIIKFGVLGELSGKIGDVILRRTKGGKTHVVSKSEITKPPSPAQLENRAQFAKGTRYAKRTRRNRPDIWSIYQKLAKGTDRSAHNLAIKDFMSPPVIEDIDVSGYKGQKGDVIRIKAKDKVMVAWVRVRLLVPGNEEEGKKEKVIEGGEAEKFGQKEKEVWRYVVKRDVEGRGVVEVRVSDLAGHVVRERIERVK